MKTLATIFCVLAIFQTPAQAQDKVYRTLTKTTDILSALHDIADLEKSGKLPPRYPDRAALALTGFQAVAIEFTDFLNAGIACNAKTSFKSATETIVVNYTLSKNDFGWNGGANTFNAICR